MRHTIAIAIICAVLGLHSTTASPFGVAYYDVDRLYDTTPSPFYNDSAYTPEGKHGWSQKRYAVKIERTAQVIDSLHLPLIALYGVENEQVVKDIVSACGNDYTYVHRTLNYLDGLDFALLYFGDMLYPRYVNVYRDRLYIEFESLREGWSLGLYLARGGYNMRTTEPPHNGAKPDFTLVMGRLDSDAIKALKLSDPLLWHERHGYGDSRSERGWELRNRIGISKNITPLACGIYMRRWLLGSDGRAPFPTLSRDGYAGGYGQFIPLFIYFDPKICIE